MEARRLHQIDFVKVDVEGAELLVVRGFLKSLHRFKPILMLEVSPRWSKDFGYQPAELLTTLQEAGYDRFDEVAENGRLTKIRGFERLTESDSVDVVCSIASKHDARLSRARAARH